MGTQADAKKERFGRDEALRLARQASVIVVARGKRVVRVDMKSPPSDDELCALLLGPTGNLRAPALRRGTTLIIGFDPETFRELLG